MQKRHYLTTAMAAILMLGLGVSAPAFSETAQVQQASPLASTDWLAAHLTDPDLVLLHLGDEQGYTAAHIEGARLVEPDDLAIDSDDLTLQMPPAEDLRERLKALGINDDSHIVVYFDRNWVTPATRVLFTLQAAGLGAQAEFLDGGLAKWSREGRAIASGAGQAVQAGHLSPLHPDPVVVDIDYVHAHVGQPGFVLIDARAPVYYTGLEPSGAHPHNFRGHIPGAINLPYTSFTNDDLTLKSPEELRALFVAAGVGPGDRVIAYCHIGQQATGAILAARAAGIDAVLYDGSFEDWTRRGQPVEQ